MTERAAPPIGRHHESLASTWSRRALSVPMYLGPRFAVEKLERGIGSLRDHKLDKLAAMASGFRHVLPPRLGGPLALLEAAPGVDLVLLEHTGFERAATFARSSPTGVAARPAAR